MGTQLRSDGRRCSLFRFVDAKRRPTSSATRTVTTSQRNLLMGAGAPSAAGCPDAGGDRMTSYLRFASGEGETADVLVEVDAAEDLPVASEQNAGLRQWARNQAGEAVAVAQSGFEQAVRRAVSLNVRA